MSNQAKPSTVDLLHLASRHQIIDDYHFTDRGVFIREGSAEMHFSFEEADMFLRGVMNWFSNGLEGLAFR